MVWVVTLIGVFVAILGAFQVQRYVAFKNATKAFRSSVHRLFEGLYPEPRSWPSDGNAIDKKLQSIFPELQAAVSDFREYLPERRKHDFDQAWQIYLHGSDENAGTHYYQYMGYSSPDVRIPDSKAEFKGNVERLLSYAKET